MKYQKPVGPWQWLRIQKKMIAVAALTSLFIMMVGCDMGTYEKRAQDSPETNSTQTVN